METNPDAVIIGGGLAGLTAAIHLLKKGLKVILIEKSTYPRHKVCGEYISNEILPYLQSLGIDIWQLQPTDIKNFRFTSRAGGTAEAQLPLGGFGISRYALDHFLLEHAITNGCTVLQATVTNVTFSNDTFTVTTPDQTIATKIVLGAYGKRSTMDQVLSRDFVKQKSPWLAVKAHFSGEFPNDLVALHNFNGGYCGVSKVENNRINICYLADYASFKKYKNIEDFQQNVLYKNQELKSIFEKSTLLFDKPLSISQVCFDKKSPVENHILMIGDTAGLIHPLCGNGMAMAIHSAKIAAELVLNFYKGNIHSREELEKSYNKLWNKHFGTRLFMGRILAQILRNKRITNLLISVVSNVPNLLPFLIKQTHGKPIAIE